MNGQIGKEHILIEPDLFKRGMRRLASGVSLVTTAHKGMRFGLIATSVSSVSAEPPTLLVCVNRASSSHEPLTVAGSFCVNLLSVDHDQIARRFSSSGERDKRFQIGDWRTLETGAPALAGSLASFDCDVVHRVEISSHTVFFGEVRSLELWSEHRAPLVYVNGQYLQSSPAACPPV